MSSDAANTKHFGGLKDYRSSEGREVLVPYRGEVARTIQDLLGGIRVNLYIRRRFEASSNLANAQHLYSVPSNLMQCMRQVINKSVQKDDPAAYECPLWGSNIILLF